MKKVMKAFKRVHVWLAVIAWSGPLLAQEQKAVGIEEVIALALDKNFDIKIAKNNTLISKNNAEIGNAGYLPTVSLSAGYDYASDNTTTEFADPSLPAIDANGAVTENLNAGVSVNYNIFSGGSRQFTYQQLKNLNYQSELEERQRIEQVVLDVTTQFLEVVSQYDAYGISQESMQISLNRFERAKENYAMGNFSRLELLNAEVDLRNDSSALIQSGLSYQKSLKTLNNIIGIAPDSSYAINGEFDYKEDLKVGQLIDRALTRNTDYLVARTTLINNELDLKIDKGGLYPSLDFSGGYNFTNTTFEANFLNSTENLGWNAGVTLSFNIFDGGRVKRAMQNSQIRIESQHIAMQKTENDIKTNILNAYDDFITNLELLDLTRRNLESTTINYERSQEAFNTGQITGLELREAQLNLINAKYNLSLQRIQTKLSEVSLYFYSGGLVE